MKKILISAFLFIFCVLLCSCGSNYTEYYKLRASEYEAIALYASENYSAPDGSRVTVLLTDITDESMTEKIEVAQEKFTYIWIEDCCVTFWNNEMKTTGLIYSERPKSCLGHINEWYNGLESKKIGKNLYLIGQLLYRDI